MFFIDMIISNLSYTDFLSIQIKNLIMCDIIDEVQAAQLYMVLACERQQKKASNSNEERHLEAIAQ